MHNVLAYLFIFFLSTMDIHVSSIGLNTGFLGEFVEVRMVLYIWLIEHASDILCMDEAFEQEILLLLLLLLSEQ